MADDLTMTARFPPWAGGGIRVEVLKNPDGTALVEITGPHAKTYRLAAKIPPCGPRGLFVAVTWTREEVILYLNGAEVARVIAAVH